MLSQLLLVKLMRDVVPQNIVHAFTVVVGQVDERCGASEHCSCFHRIRINFMFSLLLHIYIFYCVKLPDTLSHEWSL